MRVRKLDDNGDYSFGQQQANFYVNQSEGVAQVVETRLELFLGAWFLDTTDGMDWYGSVLGERTTFIRDAAIRNRVSDTPEVTDITNYNSGFLPNTRTFGAQFSIDTTYGKFGPISHVFLTPAQSAALPRPPAQPINVTVSGVTDTTAFVAWNI